jgi:hypothetical protein
MNMNREQLEAKLAELESDLKMWNAALSRKLEDSVRKTTLAFIQKGEALKTQYIEALADQVPARLKGLGQQIETERRAIEYQGLTGEIEVTSQDNVSFFAKVTFGDKEGKYPENYIKGRIASSMSDICDTDHFKERRLLDLYESKGFQTLCVWIEALRKIKIEKGKIYGVPFEELEIEDVYKKQVRSNAPRSALFTMAVSHVLWKLKQQQTA